MKIQETQLHLIDDINVEYRKLLNSIPRPDITNIPKSEVRYRTKQSGNIRTFVNANGDIQIVQDIDFTPPKEYVVKFTKRKRTKDARKILFWDALDLLIAGADLSIKNLHGQGFLELFKKYWPWVATNLEKDHLRKYLLLKTETREVGAFLKAYEARSKMHENIHVALFVLMCCFAVVITAPLWLYFAIPLFEVVKFVGRFFLESPNRFPQVGTFVSAFLTYGGIAELMGGYKKEGAKIKPIVVLVKVIFTIFFFLFTLLCIYNWINWRNR